MAVQDYPILHTSAPPRALNREGVQDAHWPTTVRTCSFVVSAVKTHEHCACRRHDARLPTSTTFWSTTLYTTTVCSRQSKSKKPLWVIMCKVCGLRGGKATFLVSAVSLPGFWGPSTNTSPINQLYSDLHGPFGQLKRNTTKISMI